MAGMCTGYEEAMWYFEMGSRAHEQHLVYTIPMSRKTRLLFVCTENIERSPTAEALFAHSPRYAARSAGIGPGCTQPVTQKLIDWADEIFVMSEKADNHLTHLHQHFNLKDKPVTDLDIADSYHKGDPALIRILKTKLSRYIR